jgi:hypothetical protein
VVPTAWTAFAIDVAIVVANSFATAALLLALGKEGRCAFATAKLLPAVGKEGRCRDSFDGENAAPPGPRNEDDEDRMKSGGEAGVGSIEERAATSFEP